MGRPLTNIRRKGEEDRRQWPLAALPGILGPSPRGPLAPPLPADPTGSGREGAWAVTVGEGGTVLACPSRLGKDPGGRAGPLQVCEVRRSPRALAHAGLVVLPRSLLFRGLHSPCVDFSSHGAVAGSPTPMGSWELRLSRSEAGLQCGAETEGGGLDPGPQRARLHFSLGQRQSWDPDRDPLMLHQQPRFPRDPILPGAPGKRSPSLPRHRGLPSP